MNSRTIFPLNAALGVAVALLAACATTTSDQEPIGPPRGWISQFDGQNSTCADVTGKFANRGEKYAGEHEVIPDGLLGEAVLLVVLPGGVATDAVRINANVSSETMTVTLIGGVERKEDFEISCDRGWLVTKHSRRGQYLGEGVVEKQYDQVTLLRQGKAGELIARVMVDAEFNSSYIFNSDMHVGAWYRFQPVQ